MVELEQLCAPAEHGEVHAVPVQLHLHSMSRHLLLQKGRPLPLLTDAGNATLNGVTTVSNSGGYCCSALHCLLLLKLDSLPLPITHGPGIPIVDRNFTTAAFILAATLAGAVTLAAAALCPN
jgi:hypothetical protein